MRPASKHNYFCWICGSAVDLRTCKTDEPGIAVHEDCHSLKAALATESKRLLVPKPAHRIRRRVMTDVSFRNRQVCAN